MILRRAITHHQETPFLVVSQWIVINSAVLTFPSVTLTPELMNQNGNIKGLKEDKLRLD